ncbi:hypothetical protein WDU94_009941 [Cyamophila willieti]
MFTHAQIRSKNEQIERYLNGRLLQFAVLYLDEIGDEGKVLEVELVRQTTESTPPWIFINGLYRPVDSFIMSFHDGMIDEWLSNSDISYDYDLIIVSSATSMGALTAAITAVTAYNKNILLCEIDTWKTGPIPSQCLAQLPAIVELRTDPTNTWRSVVKLVNQFCVEAAKERAQKLKLVDVQSSVGNVQFVNKYTISQNKVNKTALNILIASESKYKTARSNILTVDELFRSNRWPGKTGVLGNSLLGIQVVSLLNYLQVPVSLLHFQTDTLLKEFDQGSVKILLKYLMKAGISIEPYNANFQTLVDANDRVFDYKAMNADNIGLEIDQSSFLVTNKQDQTNEKNIYAVGDIVLGKPINEKMCAEAASLLMHRLYGMQHELMDYANLPAVVRGTLEYGSVGFSEEAARKKHGSALITTFQSFFKTFDHFLDPNLADYFVKVVCYSPAKQVIGLHIIGQNVSDMLLVYALNMKKVLLKSDLDMTMSLDMSGIHMATKMIL